MSALAQLVRPSGVPNGVVYASSPDEFEDIRKTDCAAVILARDFNQSVLEWLQELPAPQLPQTRLILRPDQVQASLLEVFAQCGTPDVPERLSLLKDIQQLALQFADVMETEFLRLRLDVISTNACRKFHVDVVTARLVATYRGQTTQLGESIAGQGDPSEFIPVPQGAPVLLKGKKWEGDEPITLRHRSPPIEGTGETRLLLVLDPIDDPETET